MVQPSKFMKLLDKDLPYLTQEFRPAEDHSRHQHNGHYCAQDKQEKHFNDQYHFHGFHLLHFDLAIRMPNQGSIQLILSVFCPLKP